MGMIKPINSENSNQKKLKIDETTVKVDKSTKKIHSIVNKIEIPYLGTVDPKMDSKNNFSTGLQYLL